MFVHGDRFINPRHDLVFPAGSVYFWTTRQGGGNMGENIASTEEAITALVGANVWHKEVTSATRTKFEVVVAPLTIETEMGTHT